MAPFRPSNLNKREYPGNGNVIGPTTEVTCVQVDTVCEQCYVSKDSCQLYEILGCRCMFCACPCCCNVCQCDCHVCTRTTPSGMWKTSEQYEAKSRDAWGDSTCTTDPAVCVCCVSQGCSDLGNYCDCQGFYFCCNTGASCKLFVAPSCAEVQRGWPARADANTVATSVMGSYSYFVPGLGDLANSYSCRSYWDSYQSSVYYSDSRNPTQSVACGYDFVNGTQVGYCFVFSGTPSLPIRSFRCSP